MLAVFLMFITFVYNFVAPLIKKLNILKDSIGKKTTNGTWLYRK